MTIRNDEEVLVWDRCYRLRYHKSQCHLDNVTYGVVGNYSYSCLCIVFILMLDTT